MRKLLYQDAGQVDFEVRGFHIGPARFRLEAAGRAFLTGFNLANEAKDLDAVGARIDTVARERRGFAYEGAGMACAIHDLLTLSGGRKLRALLAGPGRDYPHLIHVGAGWAFARLRLKPWTMISTLDPLLRWLSWDGYGFHQAFFHTARTLGGHHVERGVDGARLAIRDQGLGRAMWFSECATTGAVAARIAAFPPDRRADLWSGVGLAATYAGGSEPEELMRLAHRSGEHRAHLAQGAAFAAAARVRSGIVPDHTVVATTVFAGASPELAAEWTQAALPSGSSAEDYQQWRAGIRRLWGTTRSVQS